jgi:putative membrane protein
MGERRAQVGVDDCERLVFGDHPSTESEHIGVVVLACQRRCLGVVGQRGPHAGNLVRRDLLAVAGPADHDAQSVGVSHRPLGSRDAVRRVVVVRVVLGRSAVDHLMTGGLQSRHQGRLELEASMIATQVNAHTRHRASERKADTGGVALADQLSSSAIAQSWTFQPLAIALVVISGAWYLRQLHRLKAVGQRWSPVRIASFVGGLVLLLLLTCGPAAVYGRSIFYVWVSQSLTLLLIAPVPLLCGQPSELSRATPQGAGLLSRIVDSRPGRAFSSPLVGPALIPLACVVTFFGPVPGLAVASAPTGWIVQLLLLLVGSIIVLPLVAANDEATSVAVGAAVAVGFVELLVDAVPGIVLRLSTRPVSSYFDHRTLIAGAPTWLHDQQIGGGVLWCVSELLDLPFLVLVFWRWVRADNREAAEIDAALDRAALAPRVAGPASDPDAAPEPEQPWFLNDPRLRDRLR